MKTTVEEMFDTYADMVPSLNGKPVDREKAFAAFVAGIMLTVRVMRESKSQAMSKKICDGLMIECEGLAMEHIEDILRKASSGN